MLYIQIVSDLSLGFRRGGKTGQMIGTLVYGVVSDPFLAVLCVQRGGNSSQREQYRLL